MSFSDLINRIVRAFTKPRLFRNYVDDLIVAGIVILVSLIVVPIIYKIIKKAIRS